jgi:hypothetical protein
MEMIRVGDRGRCIVLDEIPICIDRLLDYLPGSRVLMISHQELKGLRFVVEAVIP